MTRFAILAPVLALVTAFACTPSFTPPRESTRVTGTVDGERLAPLEVEVYERCSPRLYLFERCPGKRLGTARIAHPGPFLVEVDTTAPEVTVVAYRGIIGQEEVCAVENREVGELSRPVSLRLDRGPCPIALPEPIRASARAPVSGF